MVYVCLYENLPYMLTMSCCYLPHFVLSIYLPLSLSLPLSVCLWLCLFVWSLCVADTLESNMIEKTDYSPNGGIITRYECRICSKIFTAKQSLKRHLRVHTDTKPYVCHVCAKRFRDPYNQLRHMSIHSQKKCGR